MAITIKTKKVMDQDQGEGRVITKIKCLSQDELPESYLSNYPHCFQVQGTEIMTAIQHAFSDNIIAAVSVRSRVGLAVAPFPDAMCILSQGQFIKEDDFQMMLPVIEKAGLRLKEIQDDIKEREKAWVGDKDRESITI